MTGFRLPDGGLIARERPLSFRFDGARLTGFSGDTLASALLAKGVRVVGRSFKLHRPRGVVAAGAEEPNALVELRSGARREPNRPATTIELYAGLEAASQNRWPSVRFDLLRVNDLFAPFLPAGFYYKTFKWPASFWERVYEPAIRRAAGLGRGAAEADPDRYDIVQAHCDVLVVGSGAAGLAAACAVAKAGARVILAEGDFAFGGGTLLEPGWAGWRAEALDDLRASRDVTLLDRTQVVGAYDGAVFAAVERVADHHPQPVADQVRERLWVIRAGRAILATGAVERLVAFPGNDRPGVMLAGAVRAYLGRFAVAAGRRAVLFCANDEAYETAFDLAAAGIPIVGIVDPRPDSGTATRAEAAGLPVFREHEVCGTAGRPALEAVRIRRAGERAERRLAADLLCVSGGLNPQLQLASQARVRLRFDERIVAFVPADGPGDVEVAGAARGVFGCAAARRDGEIAGIAAARACGFEPPPATAPEPRQEATTPAAALWEVRGRGKAFVDLQHDVTADDLRLAHREGLGHVEHAKRYTTLGMGTDQGRIGGLVGSAILAEARGVSVAQVGLPNFRPFATPVTWGALAGSEVGAHFKPRRLLPLHDWHEANGAVFVKIGLWLRPLVYSPEGDTSWGPVLEEARHVRRSVGLCDVSSLGKIDVRGPDAAAFLDKIYANTFSTLPVGKARYGVMLREDGMVFDDGTTSRLAQDHFLVTTTTQKADEVLAHMEWHLEAVWPDLDVTLTNVADHWAQFALAGPRARDVLRKVIEGLDIANDAFPFMAVGAARFAGVPGRLFRISFSGELAYEVAVPAAYALAVWERLLAAGEPFGIRPYGLDALNVLRIEKGHVTGGEINGGTTARDLGLAKMLKKTGDFVGRVLGERPGLLADDRLRLVGVRPVDPNKRLRGGGHFVAAPGKGPSQGFVTAACMAAEGEGWIGLGLLAGGDRRHGERLVAASPVYDEAVEVEVGSPHRFDPENQRVRA